MLKYAMLSCSRTGTQVTSASLCGSSVFQTLRDWHCESLKCHLLFMESQETLKAWTLSTNRSGFWFFLHLRWLNAKSNPCTSVKANCNNHLYAVDSCPLGLKQGSSAHTTNSHTKWNCSHLTFIHYQPQKSWWLDPKHSWNQGKGISEKHQRSKPLTQVSRPYDWYKSCKGTLQWLYQQSPGTQGLYLGYLQQRVKTYDVLWAITHFVKIHCCTMQQSLLKASQPWRENAILSHWQRSYGEERGRAKGVSQRGEEA